MTRELTTAQWENVLGNVAITKDQNLKILQQLYAFEGHKAAASQLGKALGHKGAASASPINSEMARYAKRIAEHSDLSFTKREDGSHKGP